MLTAIQRQCRMVVAPQKNNMSVDLKLKNIPFVIKLLVMDVDLLL